MNTEAASIDMLSTLYYRPMKTDAGYKICSPFMWAKIIVLLFLTFGATLLLIGWGG